mgnify:CR=1 FL=1
MVNQSRLTPEIALNRATRNIILSNLGRGRIFGSTERGINHKVTNPRKTLETKNTKNKNRLSNGYSLAVTIFLSNKDLVSNNIASSLFFNF